jgi:hypothetical protein
MCLKRGKAARTLKMRRSTEKQQTYWYVFRQNNTGGRFHYDDNLGERVIIEAIDHKQANKRAEELGIYFNGCDEEIDCPCCGDRWYSQQTENNRHKNLRKAVKDATMPGFIKERLRQAVAHPLDGKPIWYNKENRF